MPNAIIEKSPLRLTSTTVDSVPVDLLKASAKEISQLSSPLIVESAKKKKVETDLADYSCQAPQLAQINEALEEQLKDNPEYQQAVQEFSQAFGFPRLSPVDAVILFFYVYKLAVSSVQEERISRRLERDNQIANMQKVVENLHKQSRWQLTSAIGAAVCGIASGALPIVGHMQGDFILSKASSYFTSLQGANPKKLFENGAKMLQTMSEAQKSMGTIQESYAKGDEHRFQLHGDLARNEADEDTNTIRDLGEELRKILGFIEHQLQQEQEAVRSLYH